ncbi:unnamed protein product, partial [Rotaria sordida]
KFSKRLNAKSNKFRRLVERQSESMSEFSSNV